MNMTEVLTRPILGIESDWPAVVYLLYHPPTRKYGCYCYNGIHGLACFSSEQGAYRFAEWIDLSGMTTVETTFDEAREIAKERPMPIVSLMLLDRLDDPVIHYVR